MKMTHISYRPALVIVSDKAFINHMIMSVIKKNEEKKNVTFSRSILQKDSAALATTRTHQTLKLGQVGKFAEKSAHLF